MIKTLQDLKSLIIARLSRVSLWQIVFLAVIAMTLSTFVLCFAFRRPKEMITGITEIKEFVYDDPHGPRMVDLQTFNYTVSQVAMSQRDKRITYSLLRKFHLLMVKYKIVFVGYGGTILGAARHAALIPWDDDADFVIMKSDTPALFRAIASQDTLKLCYMNDDFYKVTFRDKSLAKETNKYCGWPNLDLLMAHDLGSRLKVNFLGSYIYDKNAFFPAVFVPFGPLHLPFPRCFHRIALQDYDLQVCCTGSWNHRVEDWAPRPACVNCSQLRSYVPFAIFTKLTNITTKVVVKIDDEVIRHEIINMPHCQVVPVQFIKPESYKPLVNF